jgi:predicted transcriptional regulator
MPSFKRDLLVSVRPKYASQILSGKKTVELRRKFPETIAAGTLALIYSSSPVQAIVGYARIGKILKLPISKIWRDHADAACISKDDFARYFSGLKFGFVILLEDVKLLKKQVKVAYLQSQFGIAPPQSYRYLPDHCSSALRDDQLQNSNRHQYRNRA